jgi:hypothetical protein
MSRRGDDSAVKSPGNTPQGAETFVKTVMHRPRGGVAKGLPRMGAYRPDAADSVGKASASASS